MKFFSFLHAADLHLDAAFKGLASGSADSSHVRKALQKATFTALSRLVDLAIRERVDAVLLAGDIYNSEDGSLKAQLRLRDGCVKLEEHSIQVFIVHGNHDPATSRSSSISWPENVTIFGTEQVNSVDVQREGEAVAVVHGISHGTAKEKRNFAKLFSRDAKDVFQVGLLHCTVDSVTHADRYAPCTVTDLTNTGLDYWALGHVHERQTFGVMENIVYPGNPQGLHINETGPRGCHVISVTDSGKMERQFHSLGPVQWQILGVDSSEFESLDGLDSGLTETIDAALTDALAKTANSLEGMVFRLRLTGRSELDADLRTNGAIGDLLERLRETYAGQSPFVWIKDIDLATKPDIDLERMRERDDLLGESLRKLNTLRNGDEELLEEALAPLFAHRRAKKALGDSASLTDEQRTQLLDDAERLCLDLLEAN